MNWAVLSSIGCYLIVVAGIGYWAHRRRQNLAEDQKASDYFMGDRSLGWTVLLFTVLASAASAGTFIGDPALAYDFGYSWVLVEMGQMPLAFLLLGLFGKRLAILGRKLNAVTINDILRHRYESPPLVIASSVAIVVFLTAYMVAQFSGGARVLESITHVPYTSLVIIFGVVVTLYTAFGGFLADAVSDTFQGLIMLVAGVAIWVAAIASAGGITALNTEAYEARPALFTLPGELGYSAPMVISFFFLLGPLIIVLPHLVVRGMSYRDSATMHRVMYLAPIVMAIFSLGFVALGPIAYARFPDLSNPELAVPSLVLDLLPGPLAGAILAAPLAAIMSTVDSMLLIVSAAIVKDIVTNYIRPSLTPKTMARTGPAVSAALGILVTLLAIQPPEYVGRLIIYAIGGLASSLFVPLFAGLYWARGNSLGATAAMLGGFGYYVAAQSIWPSLSLDVHPAVMSCVVSLALYIIGTFVGGPPSRSVLVKFWGTDSAIRALPK